MQRGEPGTEFGARDRRLHRREFGHLGAVERSVDRKAQPRDRPRHALEFKAISFRRADVGRALDRIRHAVRLNLDILPVGSEEHTSELPSLMRISYAVFCLKKKT